MKEMGKGQPNNNTMDNDRQHCIFMYVLCIYVFIVLIGYQGWSI